MSNLSSLSIVIPCHNEQDVIEDTYHILKNLINKWINVIISSYEIVMVNNGSTDHTLEKMLELFEKDKNIIIVDLRNNYGYQVSITAGLNHVSKDMVVTIDADLQDDPVKIEEMIQKYYEGYEMVLGVRLSRKRDKFLKRLSAKMYYKMLNKIGVKSVYNHGEFRLLSKQLVENFKKMNESNRYIRSMILQLESKYALVYYDRKERRTGKTKFNLYSLFKLALDGITSYSSIPIKLVFILGCLMFMLSIIGFVFVFYVKFIQKIEVPGWASLALIIMLFGGIQNLSIGIIGEYIAKTYIESKNRPLYFVRKVYKNT